MPLERRQCKNGENGESVDRERSISETRGRKAKRRQNGPYEGESQVIPDVGKRNEESGEKGNVQCLLEEGGGNTWPRERVINGGGSHSNRI